MSGKDHQHDHAAAEPRHAGHSRRAWTTLLVVTGAALVIDLLTKYWAFMAIADEPVRITRQAVLDAEHPQLLIPQGMEAVVVLPRVLEFTLVLNEGAVFGLGAGGRWFFVAFTLLAVSAVLAVFWRLTSPRDHFSHAAIGLLIGGGLGNLYDRARYASVRDFIHPVPDIWPYVSNVADLFLLVGIGGLMICFWRMHPEPREAAGDSKQRTERASEPPGKLPRDEASSAEADRPTDGPSHESVERDSDR